MAKVYGVAGEWARVRGTVLGLWPVFLGVFVLGISVALVGFGMLAAGFATILATGCFLFWSMRKGLRRIERFFKGARGEEHVSEILKTLPDAYRVYNDFLACGTHVDHVVVGPAGIFSIETKFWTGSVTIEDGHILLDGQLPDRSPITQALREAANVRNELAKLGWTGYTVTPVLAFASDTFRQHVADLHGAVIMNSCELRGCFDTKRVTVPPMELDRLFSLLENRI